MVYRLIFLNLLNVESMINFQFLKRSQILHAENRLHQILHFFFFFFFQNFHKNRYFCSKSRNIKRLNYICWQKAKFFGCFCVVQNCAELGFFFFFLFCRMVTCLSSARQQRQRRFIKVITQQHRYHTFTFQTHWSLVL